jgi:DNA repair protein REV1
MCNLQLQAREYGIKKGMYLGSARQLCPNVIVLYYDFEEYEEVSDQYQDILETVAVGHDGCAEIVSCDEASLELLLPDSDTAGELAESVRAEIFEKTERTASIGVGANKLWQSWEQIVLNQMNRMLRRSITLYQSR